MNSLHSLNSLHGLKVISLEQAVAAPLCTQRLVQAGAEVIKIERPQGDFARYYDTAVAGQSAYFVWLNAGKKSVVLDLSINQDKQSLLQLINKSDVLVQNLKPGSLAGLGVDLDLLHAQRPEFISVSISGFSPDGPGYKRKAYDLLMQAESGLAQITGSAQEPGRVGVSVVDIATGQFAYEAILQAYYQLPPFSQSKLVRVIEGKVLDIIVDVRKGSPTFGQHYSCELSAENQLQIFIPRGFAHGYITLSESSIFSYKVDNYYNKESEGSIAYDDPKLGIDWILDPSTFLISEKDRLHPNLDQAQCSDFNNPLYD